MELIAILFCTKQLHEVKCIVVEKDKQMTYKSHGVDAVMLVHKFRGYLLSALKNC
jgi:hypothetical protein